jgi:hypothetical protein
MTGRLVCAVALPQRCPDAGVAAVDGEERPLSCPEDVGTWPNLVKKHRASVSFSFVLRFGFVFLGLSLPCFAFNKWYQIQIQGEDPCRGAMGVFHTAQGRTSYPRRGRAQGGARRRSTTRSVVLDTSGGGSDRPMSCNQQGLQSTGIRPDVEISW